MLYRDDPAGLSYYEAWIDDGEVFAHWGVLGEHGESGVYDLDGHEPHECFEDVVADARAEGYAEIPDESQFLIEVQYDLDSFRGSRDDLHRRHEIENMLDNALGLAGLGHVDGGSIGLGTMEIACVVVDVDIARAVIASALAEAGFPPFTRINARRLSD